MADEYELHGGPWHGQKVAVETGRDHIHVLAPREPFDWLGDSPDEPTEIKKKEGQYSRITGMPGHMEWDGWRTHD